MTARMNSSTAWQMVAMAMQYLRTRRLRTALTTLAVVFGVSLIFAMNLVLPSAVAAFSKTMASATDKADLTIAAAAGAFAPEAALAAVGQVPGVRAAAGVLRRDVTLPSTGGGAGAPGQMKGFQLVGVDPTMVQSVHPYLLTGGRMLEQGDTGVVLLPSWLADAAPQLAVGGVFPLATASGLRPFTVVGLFADGGSREAPQVVVSLSDAQAALDLAGQVSAIDVAMQPGADREAVAVAVGDALGEGYTIDSGGSDLNAYMAMTVGYVLFDLFGLLALFMGGFLIFNTFRTVIAERRHDLALLRAIGATRRQVTLMIVTEGLVQGVVGTTLGLVLGYAIAALAAGLLSGVYSQVRSGMSLTITLTAVAPLTAIALGLLTSLLASYLPARAAGKVTPLEALRPADPRSLRRTARLSLYVGVPMLVVGALMLVAGSSTAPLGAVLCLFAMVALAPALVWPVARLFGPLLTLWLAREGDLARGNLTRQPGRAAVTAGTLMVGLATLILLSSLVTSFDRLITGLTNQSFASDALLVPASVAGFGGVIGADASLATGLRALPEVAVVAGLRVVNTSATGQDVQVMGIDPVDYPKVASLQFTQGDGEAAFASLTQGRNAIVTSLAAKTLGLALGADLTVETAEGPQAYHVVAVGNDMLTFKLMGVFISQANMAADFHKTEDVMLMVNYVPGADRTAALEKVRQAAADYPQFTVQDAGDYRATIEQMSVGVLKVFYALAALLLIPAALGLLNTLTINVIERTREIGMMRAIGGSRSQVRRMVTGEAVLLGLFGAATGIIAGLAMSYGFVQAFELVGWSLPYEWPVGAAVVAVVVALALALVAAIAPARSAARLDIIRALQYE